MKRMFIFAALVIISPQNLWATPKADSIVAFTGARTKVVWYRWAWCNDHYQPLSQSVLTATNNKDLIYFDTDVGVEKTLEKGQAGYSYLRISRSGRWVTYNNFAAGATYIIDLTAATPAKKVLLSKANCSYWCARAFWADQRTEYVFCLDNYVANPTFGGNGIYKVPLKADGTADVGNAVKINYAGGGIVDDAISVSQDGKKLGGAFPWPNTKILDIATGQLADRHNGNFGCQANLAPDNSYRFFHCDDDHFGVNMWDANLSTNWWHISFQANVPLNNRPNDVDFAAPRWSNHLMFFANNYPLTSYTDGDPPGWNNVNIWSLDSTGVKTQVRQDLLGNVILSKFSADFKSVEKSIMIAADLRYFQTGGEAWIAGGVVYPPTAASAPKSRWDRARDLQLTQSGSALVVRPGTNTPSMVSVMDVRGRLAHRTAGAGELSIDAGNLTGIYVVSVRSGSKCFVTKMSVGK